MKKSWNSCQDNTSWKFWEFNHGGILTLEELKKLTSLGFQLNFDSI